MSALISRSSFCIEGFSWPFADDLERLHQRDAGAEHGRELAAEDGDVRGFRPCRRTWTQLDCLRMLVAAMPWRRNSPRTAFVRATAAALDALALACRVPPS